MKLLRDTTPIDPEIQRRLDAIDAALAGEPVEAQYSDLAKLAQALRAERQLPAEAFADKLDERVSSGFEAQGRGEEGQDAHAGEAGRSLGRIDWSRLRGAWAPLAAGVAGSALLVSAIAGSGVLSGDSQSTRPAAPEQVVERPQAERGVAGDAATAPRTQRRGTAESATPNTKSAEGTLVPPSEAPPYPVNPGDDGARPREVARGASLVLATKPGDVEDAADQVVRITDEHRGYVLSSSVSGGEGNGRASFQLRIPASRLQAAIADLSEVAHIRERNQDTQDITSSFVSVRARIAAAQRERQALLRGLAAASTENETAAIKARLRRADRRLAQLRSQLRGLKQRVGYSSVDVRIEGDPSAGDHDGFTPSDALGDAGRILSAALASAVIALAILVPLAVIVVLVWLAATSILRQLRERALDHSGRESGPKTGPGDR